MDDFTNFQEHHKPKQQEEEDEEDTLSLCDFPLNSDTPNKTDKRRSSSEPSEFFEFFTDFSSQMSHAEDIILCGKLVPYKNQHHILKSLSADYTTTDLSRRSYPTRSNSITTRNINRSLDCKKLRRHRNSSEASDNIHRSFSKSSAKSDGSTKASRPRWFVLMFGPLKLIQPEIDLRDMKNRQVRRSKGSIFPAADGVSKVPAGRRSSWSHDLLRVLSCKSHASVAVTASIGLVPHF